MFENLGQRISDKVADTVGSWRFIIIQSFFLMLWLVLNIAAYVSHWDPYPFILLNLFLSFQAAYTGPFVMMAQNRSAARDREHAENNYKTNEKAEEEIKHIIGTLYHMKQTLEAIHDKLTPKKKKTSRKRKS